MRGKALKLDVADSTLKRAVGLMYREHLGAGSGMLFVFGRECEPGIWMRNMRFPIDIAWLDKHFRIIDLVERAKQCTGLSCEVYKPSSRAKYVLELRAGAIRAHGARIGDVVMIKLRDSTRDN